jgi:hypothetical protein
VHDEAEWVLAANVSGVPWMFTGEVAKDRYTTKQRVAGFQKTLKQVVLGYFHPAQNTQIFLLVDADDAIHVWSAADDSTHRNARGDWFLGRPEALLCRPLGRH